VTVKQLLSGSMRRLVCRQRKESCDENGGLNGGRKSDVMWVSPHILNRIKLSQFF
jgi:hypothetical protein